MAISSRRRIHWATANIDEPFVRQAGTGNEFYHTDALGSSLVLSNAQGASATTYTYEPFGKTAVTGTSANALQYTGRESDGTGLYYYRARYYSPVLGRFISEDPLRTNAAGEGNLYAYVLDDPINLVDPSGKFGVAGAVVGGGINLAVQLVQNGGNLANVNLTSVAASALAGAAGVGLATAISNVTRGVGTQLVLNTLGSAGIGAASTLGQNVISGKCLTQDLGRDAVLSGVLGGAGFAFGSAFSAINAAAATTAWNNASLSQRILATSNAISLPANANSVAVGVGNAAAITISNSGPIIAPPE